MRVKVVCSNYRMTGYAILVNTLYRVQRIKLHIILRLTENIAVHGTQKHIMFINVAPQFTIVPMFFF